MRLVITFWILSIAILVGGAWLVHPDGSSELSSFDRIGLGLAEAMRSSFLDRFMQAITWLGSLKLLLPTVALLAWWLLRRGRGREAGFLLLALLSSAAFGHIIKLWVARPRPDLFLASVPIPEDWSYPSAHAMQAVAAALGLFLSTGRRRIDLAILLCGIVLLVGVSRIYLQVHFPSDVVAGTLAAGFWVAGLYAWSFRNIRSGSSSRGVETA